MKFSILLQQQLKHDTPYAWFLRHQASSSPVYHKVHLAELDERLEAYLDCFLISQHAGKSLLPILDLTALGSVFTTALTAIRTGDEASFDLALDAVEKEMQSKEVSNALCWGISFETAKPYLEKATLHENALVRLAGITAVGHFTSNIDEVLLHDFLKANDSPELIAATLKIIGENKLEQFHKEIRSFFTHENESVRFYAAFAGNLIGIEGAYQALQFFCFNETPHLREAISLLYQVVSESGAINNALDRIQQLEISMRVKAYNIAMAGFTDKIPVLIEWMKDPEYAPFAGEAFSFITGADIEEDDLSIMNVELCESQEAPLADKRKQDTWTEYYEADLPWPDPDLVGKWWEENQSNFQNGTRYLAGHTLSHDNLLQIMDTGTQPQRHIAQLILAVKEPKVLFRTVRGKAVN